MKTRIVIVIAVVLVGIQLVPVDRHGPPPDEPLAAPADVAAVLQRSCYDCHSAGTIWPWYARVAPVSWYLAHHVEEGREHLDFSRWGRMSAADQAEARSEIVEEVAKGEMPLSTYLVMHDGARIQPRDLTILRRWAGVQAGEGAATADDDHDHDH